MWTLYRRRIYTSWLVQLTLTSITTLVLPRPRSVMWFAKFSLANFPLGGEWFDFSIYKLNIYFLLFSNYLLFYNCCVNIRLTYCFWHSHWEHLRCSKFSSEQKGVSYWILFFRPMTVNANFNSQSWSVDTKQET